MSTSALDPASALRTDPARRAAFRRAARHSRRVRMLRLALPTAALLLAATVVVVGIATRIEIGLSIGDVKITAEGLAMDAPKLSGSDGKGRTFEVNAERAVQDLRDPRIIRLYGIRATVRQPDGATAEFTAGSGIYDAGDEDLTLADEIVIRSSDGSAAKLEHAAIDLVSGDVTSDAPVAFSSSLGAIEAKEMDVGERGGSVTFGGGVRMTVDPDAVREREGPAGLLDDADAQESTPR